MACTCSDDVDDEYTEKGRMLIRKEQEARANGIRVGDILHSEFLDLELPGLKGKKGKITDSYCRSCWAATPIVVAAWLHM